MSSDDSFDDDEDFKPRSSAGGSRKPTKTATAAANNRKRRIVMRIEFDDSDESSSSTAATTTDDNDDDAPTCSNTIRRRRGTVASKQANACADHQHADDLQPNNARRLRNRRANVLNISSNDDVSNSDSEIETRRRTRGKSGKNFVVSEDERDREREREERKTASPGKDSRDVANANDDNNGFSSDSSSNELLEKCPICLLTFRQQEIGSPATCEHLFCAACIEAWSKNVQTCPIDRLEFDRIIVRTSYHNRAVVREVNVDPAKASKELQLDDEPEEDVTNCEICNSPEREDVMLLCDACNQGYHIYCLNPPLETIPEGSWYCDNCFDSSNEDDDDDIHEELNILYDDIRDMGIPESQLRVTEVHQPQILRTRQNERIRAAVLRRTRANTRATELTTTTTTSARTSRSGSRRTTTTTTTTTRTRTAAGSSGTSKPRKRRVAGRKRRRRRGARQRTYVVEYDLNNFDEKFAIKTTKKVLRRRRKRRTTKRSSRRSAANNEGVRMTASRRLAEQLGVKRDPAHHSHLAGSGGSSFSIFGNANALEYFSDSDNNDQQSGGGMEEEIVIETGHGTALQTSVRISNVRTAAQSRKSLLLGRLKGDPSATRSTRSMTHSAGTPDLLSSIMDIQDRWHNATRNMENVRISADGSLNFEQTPRVSVTENENTRQSGTEAPAPSDVVTQAPMYPRGGGNAGFTAGGGGGGAGGGNTGGTGGAGGGYNRYGNAGSNYRSSGGGAGSNAQYGRHSTGGMLGSGGGNLSSLQGRGNFNFSDPNYNANQNQNQNQNFTPFNLRFNPRNQQNNNNNNNNQQQQQQQQQNTQLQRNMGQQRNSLPFANRLDALRVQPMPQQQQQQQQTPQPQNAAPAATTGLLFGGLPPPHLNAPPPGFPLMQQQQPPQQRPADATQIFAGLPPPMQAPMGMHTLTVPPPPAPPPVVQALAAAAPWNSSLFKLTADYGNDDDDDSNCPNFSVYSQESQEVAKASDTSAGQTTGRDTQASAAAKEDAEQEDLVQLDDDDDIPLPPESSNNAAAAADLYEPENPTEENDDEDEEHEEPEKTADRAQPTESDAKEQQSDNVEVHTPEPQGEEKLVSVGNASESDKDAAADDTELEDEDSNRDFIGPAMKPDTSDNETTGDTDSVGPQECETKSATQATSTDSTQNAARSPNRSVSPALSEIKLPDNEVASNANRKNVLELYDDSDWEELDIDKPKKADKDTDAGKRKLEGDETPTEEAARAAANNAQPDRSYTPCLDENIEPDELVATPERDGSATPTRDDKHTDKQQKKDTSSASLKPDSCIADMETEMISDEEDDQQQASAARGASHSPARRNRGDKRDKRDKDKDKDNVETFKKVSNKTKGRNYRIDKQAGGRRNLKRRSSRSRSRSRSRSHSPHRNKFRSRSRSRTRSRSPGYNHVRGGRRRSRSRSPRSRSRSRSNNKENRMGGGRGARNNKFKQRQQQRPKRRELPRYDVRNVIGTTKRPAVDRYGRDASRQLRSRSRSISPLRRNKSFSRSISRSRTPRSRTRSLSAKGNRNRGRFSFSLSPTPSPAGAAAAGNSRHSISPAGRRFNSPRRRSMSPRRRTPERRPLSRSPARLRSRSMSPVHRMNGRRVIRRIQRHGNSRERSLSYENGRGGVVANAGGRFTPQLERSTSRSPNRLKGGKKKKEKTKKKRTRKRASYSVSPARRISHQRDPFVDVDFMPQRKKRRQSPRAGQSPHHEEPHWSPSPSPPPAQLAVQHLRYENDINASWTPPIQSPTPQAALGASALYDANAARRSLSKSSKSKDKHKRAKAKKKKLEKSKRDTRKEKRRKRRTETPEPAPSKEVFASGNNILVSVSFNKDVNQAPPQQTTVVTLPPNREDLLTRRPPSVDRLTNTSVSKKSRKEKTHKRRKVVDAKPVAIIDLDRSPFQVHQEPADVIVLTDSEDTHESMREHHREHHRGRSMSIGENLHEHHRGVGMSGNVGRSNASSHHDKTPPMERLDTILEESYDIPQTGPKTPPEPPLIKFNLAPKKQNKVRNPLHDDADDMDSDNELPTMGGGGGGGASGVASGNQMQEQMDNHSQNQRQQDNMDGLHVQSSQKIGPNTPPESGPCSPDAYDPFEPTKSPSLSPRSPTPPPMGDNAHNSIADSIDCMPTQKFMSDEALQQQQQQRHENDAAQQRVSQQLASGGAGGVVVASGTNGNTNAQTSALNPVDLVMALMNNKSVNAQDNANKANDSQYVNLGSSAGVDGGGIKGSNDDGHAITVLSNVLISNAQNQHIPVISSPTPPSMLKAQQQQQKSKASGSTAGSTILPNTNGRSGSGGGGGGATGNTAADDSFNMNDFDSPYSPGSADYEDLFEPPPDASGAGKRRNAKRGTGAGGAGGASVGNNPAAMIFDDLFGTTSPIDNLRLPSYTPSAKKPKGAHGNRKSNKKGKPNDDHAKAFDDMPSSAVDLQVKDKFLRKLNRQERVVEEVKLILKPRFNKKQITKEDYKEIMRRAVPKICHSRSGEINPHKIKNLIEAYVKKFRAKHKKLNLINTGQVSSAVKCAAYLKKL